MTEPTPTSLFLHARFEVPGRDASGENKTDIAVVKQHFNSTDHQPAQIGTEGEPVKVRRRLNNLIIAADYCIDNMCLLTFISKPEPGDFTYSGMHDHGPLPKPKEGGPFAHLIGLCLEAKRYSNKFLTDVIEKEKQNDS